MILPGRVRIVHVLRYVGRPLLLLFAWDVLVTCLCVCLDFQTEFPPLSLSLFGSAVAIYLSFRNTAAYARWWEARTLWGTTVNYSRNFARQVRLLLPKESKCFQRQLIVRHIAYVHALRLHMRNQSPWQLLSEYVSASELKELSQVSNVPSALLARTSDMLQSCNELDSIRLVALDQTLTELTNAQGGMERIRNTPFPKQYASYPVFFTHAFCLLLPIGMVDSLGLLTPLGSTLVGFLFLALLQIGTDMKSPFANTVNDVPLLALTRSIEIDLRDVLREQHGLKPIAVCNGILW